VSESTQTVMDVESFVARYPRLYHMAEKGTWPSIKELGLLSTSAVLDLCGVNGAQRDALERGHRPEKITVGTDVQIVLRDQKPMAPERLAMGLQDGITPAEWYELINGKVFMWARQERLYGLLGARHYRALEHDVLTIDTASLVGVHSGAIWLCPMNSGNTFPIPHHRGKNTFSRIADYDVNRTGRPRKEVVEVVVDYSVPDMAQHVVEVRRMRGDTVLQQLPL
jgi:hypothetical protein